MKMGVLKIPKRVRELRRPASPGFFGSGGSIAATMEGAVKIASLVTSVTVWLSALS
jgi:hypothetical protein